MTGGQMVTSACSLAKILRSMRQSLMSTGTLNGNCKIYIFYCCLNRVFVKGNRHSKPSCPFFYSLGQFIVNARRILRETVFSKRKMEKTAKNKKCALLRAPTRCSSEYCKTTRSTYNCAAVGGCIFETYAFSPNSSLNVTF